MKYAQSVVELIGRTPLVKLNRITEGVSATVLVKLEYLNPGGSIKDRIALKMIEEAESAGLLKPGGVVVEPTSGNTGVGLALVAQQKGYRAVFVTVPKVAQEKRDVLRAYGADVVVGPAGVPAESPLSYYGISDQLAGEIEGGYKPDQFSNPAAPNSHYETTGPEIWDDTDGKVTHLVVGAGTGGTVTGSGRYLKEVSADRPGGPVRVVVADPDGSIYSGGEGRPYFVEGVGEDIWVKNYDASIPDEHHAISDAESFAMARRLATEEGLLVGGSSGTAVAAALKLAQDLGPDDVVVAVLPDSGRGYLGKIFNDQWMIDHGFGAVVSNSTGVEISVKSSAELTDAVKSGLIGADPTVDDADHAASTTKRDASSMDADTVTAGDVLLAKSSLFSAAMPEVVSISRQTTLREAVSVMNRYGIDIVPVIDQPGRVARIGEVYGIVDVADLSEDLIVGHATPDELVTDHLAIDLPLVGITETLPQILKKLRSNPTLLVAENGDIVGVLTRNDLLAHLSGAQEKETR
ncbi:pyridoxal-phosphate dependent enzyme [Nesterenkonia sp. AY15]|uniref:pyridoxal-phosphate dependent enzyme n=1 Tax=unclassified Nesterenkonia TaxID=2629769 RepID=UPI001F4C6F56|nr:MULTISPECIES: pyridoxal-phosphate dependent enzyme [unclassified Nesterenkonia]MCH8562858.1 pyridoxal-phosphate dependent enzyme [Nesterenkonia sp. YGD6]MCH8570699.1 pyridoxal-phosphate dependent enzyme [Nesterenkonia sp. AY15]